MYAKKVDIDIGEIVVSCNDTSILGVYLSEEDFVEKTQDLTVKMEEHPLLLETAQQLHEYFQKERKAFSLPLSFKGTAFQESVWKELQFISYGETRSYLDIAKAIGKEKAVRAVGQANRVNPLPIIIPCHRVIGKNKKLTGYAGNQIEKKEFLLSLEKSDK